MNNPNFRTLRESGDYLPEESNDGAEKEQDKDSKTKKRKPEPGSHNTVSETDAAGDTRRSAIAELFLRQAKKDAAQEAVIYSAKAEASDKTDESETEDVNALAEDAVAEEGYAEQAEMLEKSEEQEVVSAYVAVRGNAVREEATALAPGSEDEPAVVANEALLQAIATELQRPPSSEETVESVEQAITTAYETVEQKVEEGLDVSELSDETSVVSPSSEAPASAMPDYEDVESSDTQSLAAYVAAQAPAATGGGMGNQGAVGMNATSHAGGPSARGQLMHQEASQASSSEHTNVADWFVPAAAAYLWGRHNGRKKAERRFAPQQKKLETTVRELVAEVTSKEARIRQLARQQAELRAAQARAEATAVQAPQTPSSERSHIAEQQAEPPLPVTEAAPLSPYAAPAVERAAPTAPERPVAAVASEARSQPMGHEAPPARAKVPPEIMNHQELLAASADIFIGSVDLRSIYEDNKISEDGLRRLVVEHHHGGDIRGPLKDEMLKKEMSYELDPMQQYDQATPEAAPAHQQPQPPMLPPWLLNSLPSAPPQILAPEPSAPPEPLMPSNPKPPRRVSVQTNRTVQPVLVAANAVAFVTLAVLLIVLFIIWLK